MSIVAIVGRPNVGKSTLFNRLVQSRQAIVEETAGVTRDRHYGSSDWNGRAFSVIDTGGYVHGSEDIFEAEIRKQAELAIEESELILFVVDAISGIHPLDEDVAGLLRKTPKPVMLVVNKSDNTARLQDAQEFYALGLGEIYPVSAINGSGTGEMLDKLVELLPPGEPEDLSEVPRITVAGRPNVGKSSLVNTLLGTERNIVTPIAGTTRDAIDARIKSFGMDFILVDTAGIRRKTKVTENIEFYSVMRSIRAIESSDVVILMIDATAGLESQDLNILRLVVKNRKGLVLVANKWDLVEKDTNTLKQYEKQLRERLAPFTDVPIIFTSVTEKQRVLKALQEAMRVYENRKRRIATAELNEVMLPIIEAAPPPATGRGQYIKIKYVTQLKTPTPQFAFFCNYPREVKESYKRFIENKLREKWDFCGVPLEIYFREK